MKRPIYKGLQALFNNLTIKKVKLFTDIKVKIIIENIVKVVKLLSCSLSARLVGNAYGRDTACRVRFTVLGLLDCVSF